MPFMYRNYRITFIAMIWHSYWALIQTLYRSMKQQHKIQNAEVINSLKTTSEGVFGDEMMEALIHICRTRGRQASKGPTM